MIDFTFPLEELEYFLLILVRVSCFVYAAPFFSMNNVPGRIRIMFSVFVSVVIYGVITPHVYPEYYSVLSYTYYILLEAIIGLLIGMTTQFCMMIVNFAGHMVDVEIGFSMAQTMDPMTRQTSSISSFLYQYAFMLIFICTGMYRYLLIAISDTFKLIPVGQGEIILYDMYNMFLKFISNYLIIGFRICLPVFCTILVLNGLLGVMAKVAPQMNMIAVGLQLKVFIGLGVMLLTISLIPVAADFIFEQMKVMVVTVVKACGDG